MSNETVLHEPEHNDYGGHGGLDWEKCIEGRGVNQGLKTDDKATHKLK